MSAPEYTPHDGECCACVPRLRDQNKASSDAWTKRTAEMQSDLIGLRHLMVEATRMHRLGHIGISAYGRAALAAALKEADEAQSELEMVRDAYHRERRARLATETQLAEIRFAVRDARAAQDACREAAS